MRVFLRKGLDRLWRTTIGITFAQYRIYRAAQDLAVVLLRFLLVGILGSFRIVGNIVAFGLQFLDRGLELGDRGADIGQLHHVGSGCLNQVSKLGQIIALVLFSRQALRKMRKYSTRKGNVPGADIDARQPGESLNDWQERPTGQFRGLIDLGVNNIGLCDCLLTRHNSWLHGN